MARAAGVRVGSPGCTGNAIIAFVADGPAAVRAIATKRPHSLQDVTSIDMRTLRESKAPIHWWYGIQPRGANGDLPASQLPRAVAVDGWACGPSLPAKQDTAFQTVRSASLIATQSVRAIYAAHVVVDA